MSPTHDLSPTCSTAPDESGWHARSLSIHAGEGWTTLRLVRFAHGWVASADSIEGPTLGMDRSPYLAARRALEPLGVGLVAAMTAIGRISEDRPSARYPGARSTGGTG